MDSSASKFYFLLFLLSILSLTPPGSFQTTQHDTIITIQPPLTTNPVTTPSTATNPPDLPTPPTVTSPSANPTAPVTFPPETQNPITPQVPVTNPVTTPGTTTPGVQQPVTNPATTYPSPTAGNDPTTPVVVPAVPGQLWCIVKSGAPQTAIQAALDYACGMTDCSAIQQGGNCYNPNSLQNHASYAFNSYYQRNPMLTSCDFGGVAMITNVNPKLLRALHLHGRVILVNITISGHNDSNRTNTNAHNRISSADTNNSISSHNNSDADNSFSDHNESNANADNNIFIRNNTIRSSITPPIVFNASSPFLGGGITGYGETPATANISSTSSRPSNLQPFLGCMIVVTTIITWRAVLDV
ncbi:hypothetical protein OROGR_004200 [Orobanche gracilis]